MPRKPAKARTENQAEADPDGDHEDRSPSGPPATMITFSQLKAEVTVPTIAIEPPHPIIDSPEDLWPGNADPAGLTPEDFDDLKPHVGVVGIPYHRVPTESANREVNDLDEPVAKKRPSSDVPEKVIETEDAEVAIPLSKDPLPVGRAVYLILRHMTRRGSAYKERIERAHPAIRKPRRVDTSKLISSILAKRTEGVRRPAKESGRRATVGDVQGLE